MSVLGIDASLRSTGYGVVARQGASFRCLDQGLVRNPPAHLHSECLAAIHARVTALLETHRPEAVALEGGFYFKNAKTALILGEVRGAVIAACALRGVPVYEYAPRRVKQGLTGAGAASKEQVGRMVASILGLTELPPEDAADALAIALCHFHGRTGIAALQPKPI
ncbi:MAG TPA: crossover junction endodeoxyribonuclease RuvC [Kiritimatiellia bacterium]|nr:crossover junction endodeoxyribonuclease RuvC [Kiritimatiellia bacterium]HRZ12897.1 crossover junction endodeoxyribonuclease RuvC [Kiritimatiellia bacterium]HSA18493.1 crossover junction endodeoxyribonuclease RuvC [Kiritimatiellia bacterium]